MIQTIPIYDIISKQRDALKNSAEIEAYCQSHYGKSLLIFIGFDEKNPPKEKDCPYAIIRPGPKSEGEDQEVYTYSMSVGWCILNDQLTPDEGIVEYKGIKEVDELGQLILKTLTELRPDKPVTNVDYDTESFEFFPQHVGDMTLEISVTPAIGGSLTY